MTSITAPFLRSHDLKYLIFNNLCLLQSTLIALSTLLFIPCAIRLRKLITKRKNQTPFPNVPYTVPSPHWYFGHAKHIGTISGQETLTMKHADPETGICTFWGVGPSTRMVSVLDARHVREVYNHSPHRNRVAMITRHFDVLLGKKSLTMLMGEEWTKQRKIGYHALFSGEMMANLDICVRQIVQRALMCVTDEIRHSVSSSQEKYIVKDMRELTKNITYDIFGMFAFGYDFCTTDSSRNVKDADRMEKSALLDIFQFLIDDMTDRCYEEQLNVFAQYYWIPTKRNREHRVARERLLTSINHIVETQLSSTFTDSNNSPTSELPRPKKSVIELMHESGLRNEYLVDLILNLWHGGYDTTSIALSYALYQVALHRDVQEHCAEEATQILQNEEGEIRDSPQHVFPYCYAVIMETLRLFPPGPNTARNLSRKLYIPEKNFSFDVGSRVFLSIWCIHRYEKNFHRPLEFLPERWVRKVKSKDSEGFYWIERSITDMDSEEERNKANYCQPADKSNFFAFSGGKRSCLGEKCAMNELVSVFAHLIRNFELEVVEGYELQPLKKGLIQRPKNGMPLKIRLRAER